MKHLGIQKSTRKLNPPEKKKILQPQGTLPPLTPYNVMQEEKATSNHAAKNVTTSMPIATQYESLQHQLKPTTHTGTFHSTIQRKNELGTVEKREERAKVSEVTLSKSDQLRKFGKLTALTRPTLSKNRPWEN